MLYIGELFSFLTAVIWAFAVVLFKRSGERVHPIALNLFKNSFAFILFVFTMYILNIEFFQVVPFYHYFLFLLSGLLGIAIGDTLFLKSLNLLGAGLTGIVYCMYAPFTIMLSYIFLGESLSSVQIVGVILILSAVIISTYRQDRGDLTRRNIIIGLILAVLANLSFATGIIIIKPVLNLYPVIWSLQVRLLGGLFGLAVFLLINPRRGFILKSLISGGRWSFTISGSFFGTYLAMVLWLAGIKFTDASIAAALNQTNAVFIYLFAALILKETINRRKTLGLILAVMGALMVSLW